MGLFAKLKTPHRCTRIGVNATLERDEANQETSSTVFNPRGSLWMPGKRVNAVLLVILAGYPAQARAGFFGPCDFCECILADVTGVKNDIAAVFAWQRCSEKFKNKCTSKVSSWFKMTYSECVVKYGGNAQGEMAPQMIAGVCMRVYPSR